MDRDGLPLWVVRAPAPDAAQAFLADCYVGLAEPRPRSAKGRRQLAAFVEQVEVGDLVAVPLDGDAALAGSPSAALTTRLRRLPDSSAVRTLRPNGYPAPPRPARRAPNRLALVSGDSGAAPARTAG